MLTKALLTLVLIQTMAIADETTLKNSDGSEYKAPRLAGDSLAIKTIKESKIKGLIRYSGQYRDTNYHSTQSGDVQPTLSNQQQYSAIGGYLGYETPDVYNMAIGATFYTAQKLGSNPDDRLGLGGLDESDGTASPYTVLGELYAKYTDKTNDVRIGRREMPNYRFVSLSNIRFSPITHEGVTYENSLFKDLNINLAYLTRQKARNSTKFEGMARSARLSESSVRGKYNASNYENGSYIGSRKSMTMLGLALNKENYTLEAWDYYVDDFVNTLYLYGDYSYTLNKDIVLTAAFQYASQKNIGDNIAGNIDTYLLGIKGQVAFKNGITIFSAYNQVAYNENSYGGGTLFVRWGTPQMFNSYQVQDSELAGTKSTGIGAQFELGRLGLISNSVIRFRYGYYDMPDSINDADAAQDRTEATFDLRYSFEKNDGFGIFTEMKGLSVQFRISYNDYKTDYDYEAYKLRYGYEFETVTKDFVDTRLYVDYMF